MKPVRIQRKRTKGWKMPPHTIYVGRPTMWGNMFHVGSTIKVYTDTEIPDYISVTPIIAVELFRHRMNNVVEHFGLECFKDLRGKNLACFCPLDKPCHADVLLEIANK